MRLITKAARYGIKLYVVMDAVTAFVLKVIIYTGLSTYAASLQEPDAMEKKKTVQIVEKLVQRYAGSHWTVYIDWFYTSIDLVKALAEMDLYVTGTSHVSHTYSCSDEADKNFSRVQENEAR